MSEYVLGAGGAVAEIRRTTISNHVRATLSYSVYKKRPVFKLRGARTAIHSHGEEGAVRMYRDPWRSKWKTSGFFTPRALGLRYIRTARKGEEQKAKYIRTFSELDEQKVQYIRTFLTSTCEKNKDIRTFPQLDEQKILCMRSSKHAEPPPSHNDQFHQQTITEKCHFVATSGGSPSGGRLERVFSGGAVSEYVF